MDYNATRKPELIKLLKESQKNETKLAVKASRLEKQLDDKKVEYQNYINNSETLDAELRAQIDDLENELKAERVRNRELSAKCDSLLVNSKGKYQSEMEELKRFINEEMEAEYCSQISHAVSDAENIIRRQQKELASFAAKIADLDSRLSEAKGDSELIGKNWKAKHERTCGVFNDKIADLEARLADVSKAESGGKVEGVFEVGDRVVGKSTGMLGTVESLHDTELGLQLRGRYDCGDILRDNVKYFRHAEPPAPPAPTCPSCAAKQKQVEELSRENEALNQTLEDAIGRIEELERANCHLREFREDAIIEGEKTERQYSLHCKQIRELEKRCKDMEGPQQDINAIEMEFSDYKHEVQGEHMKLMHRIANHQTTIAAHTATISDMSNRIALDKSSILRLTRELSAALMGGAE
ncbi:MAG: hypothetical protein ACYTBJ_26375 [Planctomycetota bacterium]|jgi:chromosome segregation ATPase